MIPQIHCVANVEIGTFIGVFSLPCAGLFKILVEVQKALMLQFQRDLMVIIAKVLP